MNFRQTVLEEGMNIFQRHGIRCLTMEAILAQLDISRGTLAEIARSKDELLEQCVDAALSQRKDHFINIIEVADNAVEAILQLLKANLNALAGHHPDFLPDLKNHYRTCWDKMQLFSENYLESYLTELFKIGTEQQLFKAEINNALVSKLLLTQTNAVLEADLLSPEQENFQVVYKLAFEYYLRGLVTAKGLRLLEVLLQNQAGQESLQSV